MNTERINALLDIRHFDVVFNNAFLKTKKKKYIIPSREIALSIFKANSDRLSEEECNLLAEKDFNFCDLKQEMKSAASECLKLTLTERYIKLKKFKQWRKIVLVNGQDVFACAYKPICYRNYKNYLIHLDSPFLQKTLKKGLGENHCHYNAAGPAFYINWLFLHNGSTIASPLRKLKKEKKTILGFYSEEEYNQLYNLSILSIFLRRYLFYELAENKRIALPSIKNLDISLKSLRNKNDAFEHFFMTESANIPCSSHKFGSGFYDYCSINKGDNQLFGERIFLSKCFSNFDQARKQTQSVFLLYLIVRRYIESFFVQNNMWFGFNNFKRFERIFELFIPDNARVKLQTSKWIASYLLECKQLAKLEVRFAPKNTYKGTIERTTICKKTFKNKNVETGLVLHFIKHNRKLGFSKSYRPNYVNPRSFSEINQYEKQLHVIKRLIRYRNKKSIELVGIDAANEEIFCRPEIFAPFYRATRNYSCAHKKSIGLTFHVGEDFTFIVNGLRAIYEAITYLDLKSGDRLGHASALATKVDNYFVLKGKRFVSTKQDILDDYCFIYGIIKKDKRFKNQTLKVERKIKNLLWDIYQSRNMNSYLQSLLLRGEHPLVFKRFAQYPNYALLWTYYRAQGKDYYLSNNTTNSNYLNAWNNPSVVDFITRYHFDKKVRENGDMVLTDTFDNDFVKVIEYVQKQMIDLIRNNKIGIETNPSSNYLIGPFSNFEEIPAIRFDDEKEYKGLDITIGTDDAGLFYTDLTNEYDSIYYHYHEIAQYTDAKIARKIKHLANNSLSMSFIK